MKKFLFPLLASLLCLALLIGAFFVVPKATQAKAPYTPITVTQPDQCTPIQAGATNPPTNYQTCIVAVSIQKDYAKGVHFSVSYSDRYCAYSCATSSDGLSIATPEGTNITRAAYPVHVLLITPYYEQHGYDTITYTFTGPSNKVSVQIIVHSCC